MSVFTVEVPANWRSLAREALIALIASLLRLLSIQRAQIASLKKQLEHERAHRGHAPFSKGPKKGEHKKPGRKKGQGPFTNRQPPDPKDVTRWSHPPVPDACEHCGSSDLEKEGEEYFSTTDVPPEPRPEITAGYRAFGHCRRCGRKWRARSPEVPDDQTGATAHRLGPRVHLAAQALHYPIGIPVCKVPVVLRELTGIAVTQGALTQHALKTAEAGPLHDRAKEIEKGVASAPNIHVDPTGWRIAGKPAALTTFATPDTPDAAGKTLYTITEHHGADELIAVLGPKYPGVVGTDRGPEYRSKKLEEWRFQKCATHIKRNVTKALETKKNAARDFGEEVNRLLDEARRLWRGWHAGRREGYPEKVARLKERMTYLLRDRSFTDSDNQRLLDGLGREHDRGNLLRFLFDPSISPDNHLAELQLRFGVIARKVSHCSKNERGAKAHAVHTTNFQTEYRALRFEEKKAKKGGKALAAKGLSLVNRMLGYLKPAVTPAPQPPAPKATDPPPA